MSLDRSLKGKSGLERHRNVLRRAERIVTLEDNEKWTEGKSVFGLVKVGHRKQAAAKKAPKADAAADATAVAGAAPAAGAAAPAAKGAAAPAAKAPAKK
jgi:small basic protein (TIGR04137 family)